MSDSRGERQRAELTYRPVQGDRVRVGLKSVFVQASTSELGIGQGMLLRLEVPLPNGVTITPLARVSGLDVDWFAADYVDLAPSERAAIEEYFRVRPSDREIIAKAMATPPRSED